MKIIILGYGKMGKIIEKEAEQRGHLIIATIDPKETDASEKNLSKKLLDEVDVVIDFSISETALKNAERVCAAGRKIVIGTTGWYSDMTKMKANTDKTGSAIIWSGNFSLGVNIFFSILNKTAQIMNSFEKYDPFVHEFHHNQKADSPSGTAIMLGDILLKNIDRKTSIVSKKLQRKINIEELHLSSTRGGSIPGTHLVAFDSPVDTIELRHTARGREGFATGAVMAAEWIENKTGFFNIDDMMHDILKGDKTND